MPGVSSLAPGMNRLNSTWVLSGDQSGLPALSSPRGELAERAAIHAADEERVAAGGTSGRGVVAVEDDQLAVRGDARRLEVARVGRELSQNGQVFSLEIDGRDCGVLDLVAERGLLDAGPIRA